MAYSDYLLQLLNPLGVYDFEEGSYNLCELNALGSALDECSDMTELLERECIVMSAEDYGLSRYEEILPSVNADGLEARRTAIISMLSINNRHLSTAMLNRILSGCGIPAVVEETENNGEVKVSFPDTEGEPDNAGEIKRWVESILPCHLSVVYEFGES